MDRRSFTRLTGLTLLASGTLGITTSHAESITVNFLHAQSAGTYDAAIAEFERENPGIIVRQQLVPFDALNAQVQARIGGQDTSIDVYGADEPRVPALANRRLIKDLSSLRAMTTASTINKAADAVSWNDKLFALPEWTSTQLLFYNKDLLAASGVPIPSVDPKTRMTWGMMLASAQKAQKAGARWGFAFEQVDRYYQLQPLFESAGAGSGLTGPNLLTADMTNAKWTSTMKWYGDLYANGLSPRGISAEQMPSLFLNGQVAFFVGGPWNFAAFNAAKDLHYGIAPHPYFQDGKAVTPTDSWAVGISPYSKNPDAAIKFATFITLDDKGALISSAANPLPPANKAAFDQNVAIEVKAGGTSTAPYGDILRYELANTAVSRPRTIGYVVFEEIMNQAFSDVRNGADATKRLIQAENELNSNLSRLR